MQETRNAVNEKYVPIHQQIVNSLIQLDDTIERVRNLINDLRGTPGTEREEQIDLPADLPNSMVDTWRYCPDAIGSRAKVIDECIRELRESLF